MSWVRVPLRQLIFSRKSDCLGCAVSLCLVCLLASFFLPSHLSFKNMYHERSLTPISVLKAGHVPQYNYIFIICGFQSLSLSFSLLLNDSFL